MLIIRQLTISNDCGVDDEGQKSLLVGSSVVLQQSSGVVITDGCTIGSLCHSTANGRSHGKSFEKHDDEAFDSGIARRQCLGIIVQDTKN